MKISKLSILPIAQDHCQNSASDQRCECTQYLSRKLSAFKLRYPVENCSCFADKSGEIAENSTATKHAFAPTTCQIPSVTSPKITSVSLFTWRMEAGIPIAFAFSKSKCIPLSKIIKATPEEIEEGNT